MRLSTKLIKAKPSFWSGVGRTFDLFGHYDHYNLSALETANAWKSDWEALGEDFRKALGGQPVPVKNPTSQDQTGPTAP